MDGKRDRSVGGVLVAQICEPEFRSSAPTQKYNMKAMGISIPGTGEAEVFLDQSTSLAESMSSRSGEGLYCKKIMWRMIENDAQC